MALKNIPSTNPHKLSAERVYRVTMALVRRLVEKGVLPPTAAEPAPAQPENAKPPSDEGKSRSARFTGILDCRPPSTYRDFGVIEGGKSDKEPTDGS